MKARLLAFGALALGPPAALAMTGVSQPSWIAIGAGVWAASVVLKILLGLPVKEVIGVLGPRLQAALWGAWSALTELGAVALYFAAISKPASVGDAIGVGVGAACLEVVVVVGPAWLLLMVRSKLLPPDPAGEGFAAWSGVVERVSTIVGHVATRGLVWAGLTSWALAPAAVFAFSTFALVDGLATYGKSMGWNWMDPQLSRRFNGFLALVGAAEAAAFAAVVFFVLEA